MTKVALVTDLHIGFTLAQSRGKSGINSHGDVSYDYLDHLVAAIDEHEPDIVINLGDIIDARYEGDSRQLLWDYVSKIHNNRYHAIGNHDQAIIGPERFTKTFGPCQRVVCRDDSVHIIVDACKSTIPDEISMPYGTMCFLHDMLAMYEGQQIYVYCHYPISRDPANVTYYHTGKPQKTFVSQGRELCDLLAQYNVQMYINGHTHFAYASQIQGVHHLTIPSFAEDVEEYDRPGLCYVILDTQTQRWTQYQLAQT